MILNQLNCPSCNINFKHNLFCKENKYSIELDKIYYYDYVQLFCPNCKQQICIFNLDNPILWRKRDEYSFHSFLINKKSTKFTNKKFLYLYYPLVNENIIKSFCQNINFDKFDSVITTQEFAKNIKNNNIQLCVIPSYLFSHLMGSLVPNYFVQKLILRYAQKFDNPILYSTYSTFFNVFHLVYKQKNWNNIYKYVNDKGN